eukprot:1973653-Rhodomonas_salina.1
MIQNEDYQNITFVVTLVDSTLANGLDLFVAGKSPQVAPNGTLSYTLADYENGTATFNLTLRDDGGRMWFGVDVSAIAVVTISVIPVNNAPSFQIPNALVAVNESAFSFLNFSLPGFAVDVIPGPDNEENQTISFNLVTSGNVSFLFSYGPVIEIQDGLGTLIFATKQYVFGDMDFNITLMDDSGTAWNGQDVSVIHFATISVLSVNNAPLFQIPSSLEVLEDVGPALFPNFTTGIRPGPLMEDEQQITFRVVEIESSATLFTAIPSVSPNGTLAFDQVPNANGRAVFNVSLRDNGGTARLGVDESAPVTVVIVVLAVNDVPTFSMPMTTIFTGEAFDAESEVIRTFENFLTAVTPGPQNERNQTLKAVFQPLESKVPPTNANWSTDVSTLFGSGSRVGQLFASDSMINVSFAGSNATLTFELERYRNGNARFLMFLVDDGGTESGGVDTTAGHEFEIHVWEINSIPSFQITTTVITVIERVALNLERFQDFIVAIDQGGWNEEDQEVTFVIEKVSGPAGVHDSISAMCRTTSPHLCTGENASLSFGLSEFRWGVLKFNVTIVDNGGVERGGIDRSQQQQFSIQVTPVNNKPDFGLASPVVEVNESSSCISTSPIDFSSLVKSEDCNTSVPFVFDLKGIIQYLSFGAFEDGPDDCPKNFLCEAQTGSMEIWPNDLAVASQLFEVLPSISLSDSSIHFKVKQHAFGEASFSVQLTDSGSGDNTSNVRQLVLRVLPVNNQPFFQLTTDLVSVIEDSGEYWALHAENVTSDITMQDMEQTQTLTFHIDVDHPELFDAAGLPAMTINGSSAMLSFATAPFMFGITVVNVSLQDDGGIEAGGIDTFVQSFTIIICPVNNAPPFTALTLVENVFEVLPGVSSGAFAVPRFAFGVSPGPSNENCRASSAFCQTQSITFTVFDNTNPTLFLTQPSVNAEGVLVFTLAPHASGSGTMSVRIDDNGADLQGLHPSQCSYSGESRSSVAEFRIRVDPLNDQPAFELPLNVNCTTVNSAAACSCGNLGAASCATLPFDFEESGETALVSVLQTAGVSQIVDFAQGITTADGYLGGSIGSFFPAVYGLMPGFSSYGIDPIGSTDSMEYSVEYTQSTDVAQHVYSVEYDTDTVAVLRMTSQTPPVYTLADRRGNDEDRLRFVGFGVYPSFGAPAKLVDSRAVCGWSTFEMEGVEYAASASGCDLLENHLDIATEDPLASILGDAVGRWRFSAAQFSGAHRINTFSNDRTISCDDASCTFYRPRLTTACPERFDTMISPASVRDSTGILGDAVIVGPPCKAGVQADWDSNTSLSLQTFLMNNGMDEALQFDGVLNEGLYIADDIRTLVADSRLPTEELAIEIWFAIDKDEVNFAGLIGVQEDSPRCRMGWSLGYESKTVPTSFSDLSFSVSLEGNDDSGFGKFMDASFTRTPAIPAGEWTHLVAMYNGTSLQLYLNSVLVLTKDACFSPPCGRILYPVPGNRGSVCQDRSPFTLGTYEDSFQGARFPHFGAISSVAVFGRALLAEEVRMLYRSSSLRSTPIFVEENWVKDTDIERPSPSISETNVRDTALPVSIFGSFLQAERYRCKFSFKNLTASGDGSISCEGVCPNSAIKGNKLTCTVPTWEYGYKTSTLFIERLGALGWTPVWQRVCLSEKCGFQLPSLRTQEEWWNVGSNLLMRPSLDGSKTFHRFVVESRLYGFDNTAEELVLLDQYSDRAKNAAGENIPGISRVTGAASFTPFTVRSRTYLLAANFWDGEKTETDSVVYEINPVAGVSTFLQAVPTNGCRGWLALNISDAYFVVAANFKGYSQVFPWTPPTGPSKAVRQSWEPGTFIANTTAGPGTETFALWNISSNASSRPIDTENGVSLEFTGASGVVSFVANGVTFVVFSRFWDSEAERFLVSSPVYRLTTDAGGVLDVELVADVDSTVAAHDVEHFMIDGQHYLVYASFARDGTSPVYRWDPSSSTIPAFNQIAVFPTSRATSVQYFFFDTPYLLVSQVDTASSLLRWNGTLFLEEVDAETLPHDVAGGQRFIGLKSLSMAHFSVDGEQGRKDYMIAAGFNGEQQTGVTSHLYRSQRENTTGVLDGPVAVQVSRDNAFVYVAAKLSRTIAGFSRDPLSGMIAYSHDASFMLAGMSFGGREIQAFDSLAISPDDANLYAVSMHDSAVVSFARGSVNGDLTMIQVIANGDAGSPFSVSGLIGAHCISASNDGRSVYTGSWTDKAIAAFDRTPATGLLSWVDRIKEGENRFGSFKLIDTNAFDATWPYTADSRPDYEQLWSTGTFPMRLGGNAQDRPWTFTAQDVTSCTIDSNIFVIVASSDFAEDIMGVVAVYSWNRQTRSFSEVQILTGLTTGASSVACFSLRNIVDEENFFLAVGNGYKNPAPAAAIQIFRFSSSNSSFVHDHSISSNGGFSPNLLYASALKFFQVGSGTQTRSFLAVANRWDGNSVQVPSCIYEWNLTGSRLVQETGELAFGSGFEWSANVDTIGASDVEHFVSGEKHILMFASSQGTELPESGR